MARKNDAAILVGRPQRCKQIALVAIGIERQIGPRADLVEPLIDIGDHLEIAVAGDGRKADEVGKDRQRFAKQFVGHDRSYGLT